MTEPMTDPSSTSLLRPEGFEAAVALDPLAGATLDNPTDGFLELTGTLPGSLPADRLRVLVRDPGTLYVYWTTDGWAGHAYRVSCYLDPRLDAQGAAPMWSHEVPATGRECWLHVPPGARGTVVLELIDAAQNRTVGRAYFHAPIGRPRDVARQSEWRVPATSETIQEGAAAAPYEADPAAQSAAPNGLPTTLAAPPEGVGPADVMLEARMYHGHVWRRPE